jgi:hypothetical protein
MIDSQELDLRCFAGVLSAPSGDMTTDHSPVRAMVGAGRGKAQDDELDKLLSNA